MSDHNMLLTIPPGNAVLNEMRLLKRHDANIIARLRMGYVRNPIWSENYNEKCDCGELLTTEHMLLHCNRLNLARDYMKHQLIKIDSFYDKEENWTLESLLFPHRHYKAKEIKNFENLVLRAEILMTVAYFARIKLQRR